MLASPQSLLMLPTRSPPLILSPWAQAPPPPSIPYALRLPMATSSASFPHVLPPPSMTASTAPPAYAHPFAMISSCPIRPLCLPNPRPSRLPFFLTPLALRRSRQHLHPQQREPSPSSPNTASSSTIQTLAPVSPSDQAPSSASSASSAYVFSTTATSAAAP